MAEFQLVGGPFDGAHGTVAAEWNPIPALIYVSRDPESRERFGLAAWRSPQPGSVEYQLAESRHQEYVYRHSDLMVDEGPYDWAQELLEA